MTIFYKETISHNVAAKDTNILVFCSEFLEFVAGNIDVDKKILDFAITSIARHLKINSVGYSIQNHYIAYFTKKMPSSLNSFELMELNKIFNSALKMFRLFLSDKKNRIYEI